MSYILQHGDLQFRGGSDAMTAHETPNPQGSGHESRVSLTGCLVWSFHLFVHGDFKIIFVKNNKADLVLTYSYFFGGRLNHSNSLAGKPDSTSLRFSLGPFKRTEMTPCPFWPPTKVPRSEAVLARSFPSPAVP